VLVAAAVIDGLDVDPGESEEDLAEQLSPSDAACSG